MTQQQWVVRTGQRAVAELRAYRLALTHFGGIVPLTVPAVYRFGIACKQHNVGLTAHDSGGSIIQATRTPQALRDLASMVAFDLIIGNGDRTGLNWCLGNDGRVYAIDNENYDPGSISLTQALRPVYRADLIDDPVYTPQLILSLKATLRHANAVHLAPHAPWDDWWRALAEWERQIPVSDAILPLYTRVATL